MAFPPDLLDELARVFAQAALDRLLMDATGVLGQQEYVRGDDPVASAGNNNAPLIDLPCESSS